MRPGFKLKTNHKQDARTSSVNMRIPQRNFTITINNDLCRLRRIATRRSRDKRYFLRSPSNRTFVSVTHAVSSSLIKQLTSKPHEYSTPAVHRPYYLQARYSQSHNEYHSFSRLRLRELKECGWPRRRRCWSLLSHLESPERKGCRAGEGRY